MFAFASAAGARRAPITVKARRHRRLERRGRPRRPEAKRRATTRAERAPAIDYGTPELRRHRREDLPSDFAGMLLDRGHIDADEYDALLIVGELARLIRTAFGLGQANGIWRETVPLSVWRVYIPDGAEFAWRFLHRLRTRVSVGAWQALRDAIEGAATATEPESFLDCLHEALAAAIALLPRKPTRF